MYIYIYIMDIMIAYWPSGHYGYDDRGSDLIESPTGPL